MIKRNLIISLLLLTIWSVKGQTYFGEQNIIFQSETNGAWSVYACDIDSDGDMDVLSASANDDKIAWYENTDGNGAFGAQQVITTYANNARSVYAADIDGDGDQDVLSASSVDDKIAWYENTDGNGAFGEQQVITDSAFAAQSVYACDIDGDGDQDVLSASASVDKIAWYENTDGNGTFGFQQVITTYADQAYSVYAADIDGDGDQDVLSASMLDDKIAWYENTDGNGTFSEQQVISTFVYFTCSVFCCDIDSDEDQDVLSASMSGVLSKILWYENTDGNGTFAEQKIIIDSVYNIQSVFACDIDGDGDQDILSASEVIAWYENIDGNGTFGAQQIITTSVYAARSVYACDIDGDGDQDVLSASSSDDKIAWYENTDGNGTFGAQQAITASISSAYSVYATDIDGDGDPDVLSVSTLDNKIAWYENTDGNGVFGEQHIITTSAIGAQSVYACDIDDDGDMDVLSASKHDDKIAWYENTEGSGSFGAQQIITTSADGARSVYACDIDGDGDQDVLSASYDDNKIAWYENVDGKGTFGPQQAITTSNYRAQSVYACDIDGDGDQDVLTGSESHRVAWYENIDGNGAFEEQQVITTYANGVWSIYACDIDGDGDPDVLTGSEYYGMVAWYENIDGNGTFREQQTITEYTDNAESAFACDIDKDGDQDVLSTFPYDDKISWYENIDGNGTFGEQKIITTSTDYVQSVYASDIDGDGDLDVLSASQDDDKIAWYENFTFESNTSVKTLQQKGISIYPNPTTGMVYFDFANNNIQQVTISDITGNQIMEKTQIQQNETIDISGFENGIYIISIQTDEEIFTLRIVKE